MTKKIGCAGIAGILCAVLAGCTTEIKGGGYGLEAYADADDGSDTGPEGDSTDKDKDEDDDGVTVGEGDCDDGDENVYPGAGEVWISTEAVSDQCSDDVDNDCNGLTDADDDPECGDADGDGIPNGIDMLWGEDADGDGKTDSISVLAEEEFTMRAPWNAEGAFMLGDAWGDRAFTAIDVDTDDDGDGIADDFVAVTDADRDGDGTYESASWTRHITGEGLRAGNWNFTLVSAIASDGTSQVSERCDSGADSTTWMVLRLGTYCELTGDPWCRTSTTDDSCEREIEALIHVTVLDDGSIQPSVE